MADIERRKYVLVNTDPQRRCYDGCHYSSEIQALPWEPIERGVPQERAPPRTTVVPAVHYAKPFSFAQCLTCGGVFLAPAKGRLHTCSNPNCGGTLRRLPTAGRC